MKSNKKKFEESYFEGWFKGAVGEFSREDLEMSRRWFYAWIKKLGHHIPLKGKGKKALEIGFSIGGSATLLKDKGFTVYASDISEYAVQKAKKLSPGIHFSTFDVQKGIPLKHTFDLITSFEVVEHLKKPQAAIKHMYNALKPGGYIVISTPYPYPWCFNDPTHINVKYPDEWIDLMKKAGFVDVAHYKFSLVPFLYRFNKHFQLIIPFHIPFRYINTPIFYIGRKK